MNTSPFVNPSSFVRSTLLLAFPLGAARLATAGVITVGPSGSNFTDVQSAVNAAAEGDTILVRAGSYAGFNVAAKSLDIVADPQGAVTITSPVVLHDHLPGQRLLLSGMSIGTSPSIAVQATNVGGALRFEADTIQTTYAATYGHGAILTNCTDVAFLGCNVTGSLSAHQGTAGAGMQLAGSRVALYDCTVTGGPGYAGYYMGTGGSSILPSAGGIGCEMDQGTVMLASGSSIRGGTGGGGVMGICFPGPIGGQNGAIGGTGLVVDASSQAHALDSLVQGGAGGAGGAGAPSCGAPAGATGPSGTNSVGPLSILSGARRKLTAPTHVRELNSVPLTLDGQPGDIVWVRIGTSTDWQLALPFGGVQLFSSTARRALLGTVPGSGSLGASLYFSDLGPGVQAKTWHMQGVFRDASGQTHYGSAAVLVVLDQAF